jgi:adenylate cyclase
MLREVGGEGYVHYPFVGDTINTGSRLEGLAPAGGVLVGADTYARLPDGAIVEAQGGLQVRGKDDAVGAYVLLAVP